MGQSILVFISHSSVDKDSLIQPIVDDLEEAYINVWIDNRKIVPGDNLRKSIFRDGLDKADVVLIFFTAKSLSSAWVDSEIKHVLREEKRKGNNFDLSKIISIFDSKDTYDKIVERYPELTDDLCHLMPENYTKTQLAQLISAIWSKYFLLQGGDIASQKQMLSKDKEIFQKDKEIQELKLQLEKMKNKSVENNYEEEFNFLIQKDVVNDFIESRDKIMAGGWIEPNEIKGLSMASLFGLVHENPKNPRFVTITDKGKQFFKWLYIQNTSSKS